MESKKKKPARPPAAKREKTYHHGDLAAALVEAAEAVLTERGVEGFTLRECARRAGVSHAAPAHHFGDARGLLSEVAALGFERLTEAQRVARSKEPELKNLLIAAGVSYVRFALCHPAQFQLMFQSGLLDQTNKRLQAAGPAAYAIFLETYAAVTGQKVETAPSKTEDPGILRQWAMVHGLATLAVQGQFGPIRGPAAIARLLSMVRAVLENAQQNTLRVKA
jgi:AcrR family transcriptional regulator